MKPLRPIVPGGNLWAEDENAKAAELVRLSKLKVDGGDLDQTAGGPQLTIPGRPLEFWARIDTTDAIPAGDEDNEDGCSTAYGWVQQRPLPGGCFEDLPNGLSGVADTEPAFATGGAAPAADEVVWLRRGQPKIVEGGGSDPDTVQMQWLFEAASGGACPAPGDPTSEGWTAVTGVCHFDLVELRCLDGVTTEYRRVRIFLAGTIWLGPWGVTNPPAEP